MIKHSIDQSQAKGWFAGPWNSDIATPIGYANKGIDDRHFHREMFEVYLSEDYLHFVIHTPFVKDDKVIVT